MRLANDTLSLIAEIDITEVIKVIENIVEILILPATLRNLIDLWWITNKTIN